MKKIFIVEDDLTIQAQLKTLLSGNGYEVFAVTDFSQTIQQIKAFVPHLVILDIKLPGNNGFEICSEIRTFSDVPIVFVTGSSTDMDELHSIMLGGDAFFTKPCNKRHNSIFAIGSAIEISVFFQYPSDLYCSFTAFGW